MTSVFRLPQADAFVGATEHAFGFAHGAVIDIKFAPGARYATASLYDDDPVAAAKSLCRSLDRHPADWCAEAANRAPHEDAQAWVLTGPSADGGRRLAIVSGLSFAYLNVARESLITRGWRPGLNREAADQARVGSGDPAGSPSAGQQYARVGSGGDQPTIAGQA